MVNLKRQLGRTILSLLLLSVSATLAQSPEPKRKVFHVTEVSESIATDECYAWACTATRISVKGFVKAPGNSTIHYNLECTEILPTLENKKATRSVCARLEAGEDYLPKMYPTAVNFWEDGQRIEGAIMVIYNIMSQREVH